MRMNRAENISCLHIFMGLRVGEGWLLERLSRIRDVDVPRQVPAEISDLEKPEELVQRRINPPSYSRSTRSLGILCLSKNKSTNSAQPLRQDLLLSRPCIISPELCPPIPNLPRLVHNHIDNPPHPLHFLFHHPSTSRASKAHRVTHVYRNRQPFRQDLRNACRILKGLFADVDWCGKRWVCCTSSLWFPVSSGSTTRESNRRIATYVRKSIDKTPQSCLL